MMPPIQTATVKQLAYKIKGVGSKPSARFALFLGAGASVQSGIPAAAGMIQDFKRRIFEAECPEKCKTDAEKEKWLSEQSWYDANKAYCSLFEHFEPKEIGRQRHIESLIEGHKPSFGYVMLANLMATGYINTIITTNFDDLVYSACTTFTDIRPIVYAYGVLASEMRVTARRPKVLKLHGDYLYSALKNTGPEIETQDLNMARQVSAVLNEYGLIVVGYGGNDQSVMRILSQISPKNDLYWCVRTSDEPNQMVKELLAAKGGFLVKTDGFDETMNEIRGIVGFDVTAMLGSIRKRQDEMIDQLKRFAPENKIADVLSGVAQALEQQATPTEAEKRKQRALSYFAEAVAAQWAGRMGDAEKAYLEAIRAEPSDARAHAYLGDLLAKYTNRFADAEAAYREAIKLGPKQASAYNRLGILLVRVPSRRQEAQDLFREAMELEPENAAAYINLGWLMWATGRVDETNALLRQAIEIAPGHPSGYRFMSLLLRLQGRDVEAIPLLQKALELDQNDFDSVLAMAGVDKKLGKTVDAERLVAEARTLVQRADWYSLACLESLAGNVDGAIENLRCAARTALFYRKWARHDPDLEWVRDDPRFQEIVGEDGGAESSGASAPDK